MRLGLWRMVPLGASSAHTTCACLATSIPTTQRISGDSMAPLLFSSRSLIGRSPGLSPAVPSSIGARLADGAAVRPSTVRTREAGAVGFFGRSSPPIGGPQTVTCQISRGWLLNHNIRGGAISIPDWCANRLTRLTRLRTSVGLRAPCAADLACLRTGQAWLLQAAALLSREGDQRIQEQTFTTWRAGVARRARQLPPPYAHCLAHCVGVLTRRQPHRLVWTTLAGLPRTNNDLQRCIRARKTRS